MPSYNHNKLLSTFKSRIKTWDRAFQNMMYCARVINKILNRKNGVSSSYNRLLIQAIENIQFIIDPSGKTIPFSEVTRININANHSVHVYTSRGTNPYDLFTKNPKNGAIEHLYASGLRQITIDHEPSLSTVLDNSNAQKKYPAFKKISDLFFATVYGNAAQSSSPTTYLMNSQIRKFKDYSNPCINNNAAFFNDPIFQKATLADLNDLFSETDLIILHVSHNSSKGNGNATVSTNQPLPTIHYYILRTLVDEKLFKAFLLQKKTAVFNLIYNSGAVKTIQWKAGSFKSNSSLRSNIQSRPFWRKWKKEGLEHVDVVIE